MAVACLTPCPVCSAREARPVASTDRVGRPLNTVLCLGCGLYRTDPLPGILSLRAYYAERYRLEYQGAIEPKAHHILRAARAARDRLRWLAPHLPPPGRWLDAGAGGGEFAYLIQRSGFQVLAVEPNRGYADYIERRLGLPVRRELLEDITPADGPFAGISCFHVLEHHPEPVAALRHLRSLLAPGGVLAVEVPHSGFMEVHPRRRFHAAHVVHFLPENLVLAARGAGLAARECRLSRDGGIIWAVFEHGPAEPPHPLAEAASAVARREDMRSAMRYYTSPRVWQRTLVRLGRLALERWQSRSFTDPASYLSRLPLS